MIRFLLYKIFLCHLKQVSNWTCVDLLSSRTIALGCARRAVPGRTKPLDDLTRTAGPSLASLSVTDNGNAGSGRPDKRTWLPRNFSTNYRGVRSLHRAAGLSCSVSTAPPAFSTPRSTTLPTHQSPRLLHRSIEAASLHGMLQK